MDHVGGLVRVGVTDFADSYGQGWRGETDIDPSAWGEQVAVLMDFEAGHRPLTERGVKVSGIRHKSPIDDWKGDRASGPDPDRRDDTLFADFAVPDGNTWTLPEIGRISDSTALVAHVAYRVIQ
ncbi:hypothetical protein [Streptomyces sp. NPDC097610]|uniref:hypothetical protein n=1 Tax=Streptomyces sp. NPDC097610 TaxID=3157227 RepID=UPI00331F7C36